jgi:gas vesicle protein
MRQRNIRIVDQGMSHSSTLVKKGAWSMNRIVTGLLMGVGVGVVSGLAILLLRGEKTQRFLRERWQQLRRTLPEPEHVRQYAQHVADLIGLQATSEVKDTTQQAMKRVRVAGGDLGDVAQQEVRLGSWRKSLIAW